MNLRNPSAPALDDLIDKLQSRLNASATAATREWWTKYLRGAASFRGVKMGDVRTAVHAWFEEEQLGKLLSADQQKDLALMLLEEEYTEDKAHWTGVPICPDSRASLMRGISATGASATGSV
jgi:uncharacterized protein with von Willebrand factor type A (vWA) domain